MESKNTPTFEAKTEQKINYQPDFGGLPHAERIFFRPETNFRCSVNTKLKVRVYLEPPRSCGFAENWIEWASPRKIGLDK